jgi:hypothetical protein
LLWSAWVAGLRINKQQKETPVEIPVSVGEWIQALSSRMANAVDGDCFLLPTLIHLHAFELLQQEERFAGKKFKVKVEAGN